MVKDKDRKDREKDDRRRDRFWKTAIPAVEFWLSNKFGFSHDGFDPSTIDGPVIVAINHASAYDPIFVGVAFRKKRLTFIASEHILRSKWGPFLDKHISFIPHQKGARSSRTALVAMKRIKKGESIFLAVEGEQTWDGKSMPVMPYTGKLVKSSGATLVNYRLEGAYLSAPRWGFGTRKGKVYGYPAGVYSPGTLKDMTDEEVEALIAKDLDFDTWEWQRSQPGGPVRYICGKGGNADGLERSVFTCPACGATGTLKSKGDSIGCSCGFRVRMLDTGFFEQPAPFETVCEWEELDRRLLSERFASLQQAGGKGELFADDDVTLVRIEDGHNEEEAACGRLTFIYNNDDYVLNIGDLNFSVRMISNMTMVLAARVVFSDKSGYYELRSAKGSGTNLRKYVIARDIIHGMPIPDDEAAAGK